jgi:hypothetical protein
LLLAQARARLEEELALIDAEFCEVLDPHEAIRRLRAWP